ncbi:hypothetical protein EIP91_000158 [Steccherinum ochraceum]|uniref:Uncharacterized protein n=1 Tax=Steccherinum ochraceum TaxID=92696 RepID=A0A4R0RT32_9APHY|nr:hypothetical protein EIP91_000158 [Steccherinum ochraceum]
MRHIPAPSYTLAALVAASFLPTAHAYCYFDEFGFEHCRLSTGSRVGIAIGLIVLALGLIAAATMIMKRRRMQHNATYITQPQAPGQQYNTAYQQNYQPGYGGGYGTPQFDPNGPQYPPKSYAGYDASAGFAPPSGPPPPQYAYTPPPGPPPGVAKE